MKASDTQLQNRRKVGLCSCSTLVQCFINFINARLKFMQIEDVIPICIFHNAEISDNLGFSWFALLQGVVCFG